MVTSGTDRTAEIVRSQFPGVRVVALDHPALPGEARNAGLRAARAPLLALMDSDDVALPHLLKSDNPHVIAISPPLLMEERWFAPHVGYTMAKFGMSMCVLGMAAEFEGEIAVNALWPRTEIGRAHV